MPTDTRYRPPDVASSFDATSGQLVAINNRAVPGGLFVPGESRPLLRAVTAVATFSAQDSRGFASATGYIRLAMTQCRVVSALWLCVCPSLTFLSLSLSLPLPLSDVWCLCV